MKMWQQLKHRFLPWGLSLILLAASLTLGLPSMAYAQSTQDNPSPERSDISAREIFRAAYENRYTWDETFPGYSAEVSTNYNRKLDQGIIRVKPDLTVEVINIKNDELQEVISNQLQMEVIHRRRVPFEELHGKNRFEFEGTDESGALKIREVGEETNAFYKVKDNIITQVNRSLGDITVTVDTLGTAKNPEGYVVTHFQTTFRDAETGEILEKQDVRDVHEHIGKYYLLSYRTIRSTKDGNPEKKLVADALIQFNDIQAL